MKYAKGDYIEVTPEDGKIFVGKISSIDSIRFYIKSGPSHTQWFLPLNKLHLRNRNYNTKAYRKLSNEEVLQWKMEL
jgi:hypothetical protein